MCRTDLFQFSFTDCCGTPKSQTSREQPLAAKSLEKLLKIEPQGGFGPSIFAGLFSTTPKTIKITDK